MNILYTVLLLFFSSLSATDPLYSCQSPFAQLDHSLPYCWEELQNHWQIDPHKEYQKQDILSFLIDYHKNPQGLFLRFKKKELFNYCLEHSNSFLGSLKLKVLLIQSQNLKISSTYEKSTFDKLEQLLSPTKWSGVKASFDLSELALENHLLSPPYSERFSNLLKKYRSSLILAIESEGEKLKLVCINPQKNSLFQTKLIDSSEELESFLDGNLSPHLFISQETYEATLRFYKPFWQSEKVESLLLDNVEIKEFYLSTLNEDYLDYYIQAHWPPERSDLWVSFLKSCEKMTSE